MPSFVLISPEGLISRVTLDSLEAMQKAVGGSIEIIHLVDCDMIVNEDGDALDLPVNPVATRFAKEELAKIERMLITMDGWVVGPALLVGKPNKDGDETDCPKVRLETA